VGQDEDPFAAVGRAGIGRSNTCPFRIEPERGQVSENLIEPHRKQPWDVFQEDEAGSHFPNDSRHIRPDPPLVVGAEALACDRSWLARKPTVNQIHDSTPRATAEGSEVVPDRSVIQGAVLHMRDQARGGKCFPLHVTDGASDSGKGEVDPADAGTKREGT
jgi:hypothetical protein